jgi:hypothetical protein
MFLICFFTDPIVSSSFSTGGMAFWDFIHFIVSYRTPLYLMLMPLIQTKVGPDFLANI